MTYPTVPDPFISRDTASDPREFTPSHDDLQAHGVELMPGMRRYAVTVVARYYHAGKIRTVTHFLYQFTGDRLMTSLALLMQHGHIPALRECGSPLWEVVPNQLFETFRNQYTVAHPASRQPYYADVVATFVPMFDLIAD